MITLMTAAADLRLSYKSWVGVLVVVTCASLVLTVAIAGSVTASSTPGDAGRLLASFTTPSAALTLVAAAATLNVVSALAVADQRRSHALWQLAGLLPRQVGGIAVLQLAQVAFLGLVAGMAGGALTAQPLFDLVFSVNSIGTAPPITVGPATLLVTSSLVIVSLAFGGVRSAVEVRRVPALEAVLRPPERPVRVGVFRWILLGLSGLIALPLAVGITTSAHASLEKATLALVPLSILLSCVLTLAVSCIAPIAFPNLLKLWTAAIPTQASVSWYLARNACQARLARSSSTITPLMIGTALTSSLFTVFMTSERAQVAAGVAAPETSTINTSSILTVLAGPLLLCTATVAVVVYMTSRKREREYATIIAAGGTSRVILGSALLEAAIYAVTAGLAGLFVASVVGWTLSAGYQHLAGGPTAAIDVVYGSAVVGIGLMVLLAGVGLPATTALRSDVAPSLAAE